MVVHDIIARKRDGFSLSSTEISFFIQHLIRGEITEEQAAAFLMAVYIRGLEEREIVDLTLAMAYSGKVMDLSFLPGVPVDKHSTGGVGDKLTLVVVPLAAAAGVTIAKMSGRGLGHTGGTIDKLEAITGLRTELSETEFRKQVSEIGLAVIAQSNDLVPADKILYDLRNRTATVASLPLIASSIMSKKIAAGSAKILLDVTVGSGAFMKNVEDAEALAQQMVAIGRGAGRETLALITNMEEPLGYTIGNALEVAEAIATLRGEGPRDLEELAIIFASEMIRMAGLGESGAQRGKLMTLLREGKALTALRNMVIAQGGDANQIDDPSLLPQAAHIEAFRAPASGYLSHIDALGLGEASVLLGAGRLNKGDLLDFAAGITLRHKVGEFVTEGEELCLVHGEDSARVNMALPGVREAFVITREKPASHKLLLGRVE
ncbi:MAG: thymidine phosphorylase [Symbiobacteriaceae bacterium]|nr:thymidine phosphorylase [Symbiobacteriaceae bacterium]